MRPDGRRAGVALRVATLAATVLVATVLPAAPAGAATSHRPTGRVTTSSVSLGDAHVNGWAIDPDTKAAIKVYVTVDGRRHATVTANLSNASFGRTHPHYGPKHGYAAQVPLRDGTHRVCVVAINAGKGSNATLGCATLTGVNDADGAITSLSRTATGVTVAGWAVDPDTTSAVTVNVSMDGGPATTVTADASAPSSPATYAALGSRHGFSVTVSATADAHSFCITVANVGLGHSLQPTCMSVGAVALPGAPANVAATVTTTSATLTWTRPAGTGGPVTGYLVTIGTATAIHVSGTSYTATGLQPSTAYTATVAATDQAGTGPPAAVTFTTASPGPPPISTSHYLRTASLTGNATTDAATMTAMGEFDAAHDPAGHPYLVLLDIGGQESGGSGVMLSATTKTISYPELVSSVEAYVDGYVRKQLPNAPLVLALGTNNDMTVNATTGAAWADDVVDPVAAYAAKYPTVTVAGADDMEPGFSATAKQTEAWLTGYLGATSAPFVFNGSADGCPQTLTTRTSCNNGWTTTELNYLAGGADPSRISVLPQIYNTAMPKQWAVISAVGATPLQFDGPLTEYTACTLQKGGCSSATNNSAWNWLFAALNPDSAAITQPLPYGTDLSINQYPTQ